MYKGIIYTIQCGLGGLHTDDPHTVIPNTDLIKTNNISLDQGAIQKAPGSIRFNKASLGSGVVGGFDWWPNTIIQRFIAVTRNGQVWRLPDGYNQAVMAPTDVAQTNLLVSNQVFLVSGGAESPGRDRKLFILSGNNPIQVIKGDATGRYNMTKPSVDWTGAVQPFGGIIHRGRLAVWGNINNPHNLYMSNPDDHEDYQTFGGKALNFTVYPGEGEKILGCVLYKGRLFIFKYPSGIYYLDDADFDTNNWAIRKYMDGFGMASPHSGVLVLDDMLVANSFGTVTSGKAVQYFGGVTMADLLLQTRNIRFVRENISQNGTLDRHAIFYEDKKLALFAYRSTSGTINNRILYIDFSMQNPRIHWGDKDQPNFLALRKDVNLVPRPVYGAEDGYIYLMDQVDRAVGLNGFMGEFMTPHLDLGSAQRSASDPPRQLAEINKIFDFLEITFVQQGKWNLSVDVFIDGKYSETIQFPMAVSRGTNEELTNIDRTYDEAPASVRRKLSGFGKRIALRCYNSGFRQNFKVLSIQVYFRPGTQAQKADT